MLVGNFAFLDNGDLPQKISQSCSKAEREYLDGFYTDCLFYCRQALEFFTRWVFEEEIFFYKPVWYTTKRSTLADMIDSSEFEKALGDTIIYGQVHTLRKTANEAIHDSNREVSCQIAFQCLKNLFIFFRYLYNRIYEDQYNYDFFEPYYTDEYEEPLECDYIALIEEESDSELKAKYALLQRCKDKCFKLNEFLEPLPDDSGIRRLGTLLTDSKEFRAMLKESPNQLRILISNCYRDFDYREERMVVEYSIRYCREHVKKMYESIQQFVQFAEDNSKEH